MSTQHIHHTRVSTSFNGNDGGDGGGGGCGSEMTAMRIVCTREVYEAIRYIRTIPPPFMPALHFAPNIL